MKKLRMVLFVATLFMGCASTIETIPVEEMPFGRVVEMPGYTQAELYNASRIWLAERFPDSRSVVEYGDKEVGVVIGNGWMDFPQPCAGIVCKHSGGYIAVPAKDRDKG